MPAPYIYIAEAMLVGKRTAQSIFPYNIIEDSPSSFAHNSVFVGPNDFKFVQRHVLWSYRPGQNLGQIDHNLHNHVFDDVICKPHSVLYNDTNHSRLLIEIPPFSKT